MSNRQYPNLDFERDLWKQGYLVIGVDEVGRGALAGPLYVGAVCFKPDIFPKSNESKDTGRSIETVGIDDSKRLSPKKRIKLTKIIKKEAIAAGTAWVSVSYINRRGIVAATQVAMRQAINFIITQINYKKIFLISDAFFIKYVRGIGLANQKAIVRGDQRSVSIAAASVLAKVERDLNMYKLYQNNKVYNWSRNKGYGTKEHIEALKKYGKSKDHRDLYLRKII